MSDKDKLTAGMEQMGFKMVDNGVLELPTSTPATYEFTEPASYNPEAFAEAVEEYDFGLVGENTKEKEDGSFYYYVDVVTDHYKKVAVKVWKDSANIYPKEELVDTYEFSRIVHAIEDAFQAQLEHTDE
jgi:hypothetical protein